MSDHLDQEQEELEGIAVIGMAGRLPGAHHLEAFWENLCQGRESIRFFSEEELLEKGVAPEVVHNPQFVKATAELPRIDLFDAAFFDCTPRDAQVMDPQFRLFLETAWHALEDAGYAGNTQNLVTGVFAGCSFSSYMFQIAAKPELIKAVGPRQVMMVNDKDHLPMLAAYKLNLQGPAVNIQSGCTTTLTATHFACQSLQDFQCDMVLAGGVSLNTLQEYGYFYQEGGMTPKDGHCRAFDADSQGSMRADGLGVLVLKRLEDAMRDGDRVVAVIKGSAINNDGATKVGYAAPGLTGQTRVALAALELAEVEADSISFLEAHGTGTPLGDSLEIMALAKAFRQNTDRKGFCALGSVKTNIGYLDATSGMASLIKTCLSLYHKQIPASLHYRTPNPRIDFTNSPFYVVTETQDWPEGEGPRRACVNGYGMGGTNAFFVLEEAPPRTSTKPAGSDCLLMLSARTPSALAVAASNLAGFLDDNPDVILADAAYTLQVGRKHFPHRSFIVASSAGEASRKLRSGALQNGKSHEGDRELVCILPDPEHGADLIERLKTLAPGLLKREVMACMSQIEPTLRHGVEACFGTSPLVRSDASSAHLNLAHFAAVYALGKGLLSLGIKPAAIVGRGMSELAAACLAEVMTLSQALKWVSEQPAATGLAPSARVRLRAPRIPLLSMRTGTFLTEAEACDQAFWTSAAPQAEQLEAWLTTMAQKPNRLLIELGSGGLLATLLKGTTGYEPHVIVLAASPSESLMSAFLNGLGEAWLAGVAIDWPKLYGSEKRLRVALPGYPFEGQSYWVEPDRFTLHPRGSASGKGALKLFDRPALSTEYLAPRTETEKAIVKILENQLGIDSIGIQDNFFELGGNSMMSVMLASKLGKQFGVSFSPTLFLTTQSLAELAVQIGDLKAAPAAGVLSSPIVPLQPKGERPPTFLVHPMGGGLFVYRDLAREMDRDQPLFGLQAADLVDVTEEHTSIEQMAAHYLDAINEFRPHGPIVLGGWSFGGYVAYEMARQAAAAGRQIPALLILDTAAPNEVITSLEEAEDMELLYSAGRDAARNHGLEGLVLTDEIKQLSPGKQLDLLLDFLHQHNLLSRDRGHDWMKRIAHGWKIRGQAVNRYRPHPYQGRTVLFRATELDEEQLKIYPDAYAEVRRHPLLGWDEFIPTSLIHVYDIPGFHNTIATGPNAKRITTHLRTNLDQLGFGQIKIRTGEE